MGFPKKAIIQISAFFILTAALYSSVLPGLVKDWWMNPNWSHGFLILPVSFYLIWERRNRLKELQVDPCNWGLLVLLGGLAILILGKIATAFFLMQLSLIIVISGLVLFLLGTRFFKALSFPILFLIFMIPIPYLDVATFPLQLFSSRFAAYFLQLLRIPVLREGNIIYLASCTLEVAEACSGIRSLISLIALGVVYSYFTQKKLWKRILLTAFTVPIAIIANALRVAGTGLLAHFVSQQVASGFFHYFSGWLVFLVAFLFLVGLGFVLSRVR